METNLNKSSILVREKTITFVHLDELLVGFKKTAVPVYAPSGTCAGYQFDFDHQF